MESGYGVAAVDQWISTGSGPAKSPASAGAGRQLVRLRMCSTEPAPCSLLLLLSVQLRRIVYSGYKLRSMHHARISNGAKRRTAAQRGKQGQVGASGSVHSAYSA